MVLEGIKYNIRLLAWSDPNLIHTNLILKRMPLHHSFNRFVIITLYFEIGYTAITLRCFYSRMS
jgi:hypothetical protein